MPTPAHQRNTALVGRSDELRDIEAALLRAGSRGWLLIVHGDPGVGKTTLVRAALRGAVTAETGALVLLLRLAVKGAAGLDVLVDQVCDTLVERTDNNTLALVTAVRRRQAQTARDRGQYLPLMLETQRAVREAAGPRPVIVILDNVHLAAERDLGALGALLYGLRSDGACVVVSGWMPIARPGAAAALAAAADQVVALAPLTPEETAELADRRLGWPAAPELVAALRRDLGRLAGNPRAALLALDALREGERLALVDGRMCLSDPDAAVPLPGINAELQRVWLSVPERRPAGTDDTFPGDVLALLTRMTERAETTVDDFLDLAGEMGSTAENLGRVLDTLVVLHLIAVDDRGRLTCSVPALGTEMVTLCREGDVERLHAQVVLNARQRARGNVRGLAPRLADHVLAAGPELAESVSGELLLSAARCYGPDDTDRAMRACLALLGRLPPDDARLPDILSTAVSLMLHHGDADGLLDLGERLLPRLAGLAAESREAITGLAPAWAMAALHNQWLGTRVLSRDDPTVRAAMRVPPAAALLTLAARVRCEPEAVSSHAVGGHAVGCHAVGCHAVGSDAVGLDVVGPDVAGSAVVGPDAVGADVAGSDVLGRDVVVPDAVAPDVAGSDVVGPDVVGSHVAGSDVADSDRVVPDVAGSDVVGPDVVGSHVVGPDGVGPDVVAPDVVGPDVVGPDGVGPDVVGPGAVGAGGGGSGLASGDGVGEGGRWTDGRVPLFTGRLPSVAETALLLEALGTRAESGAAEPRAPWDRPPEAPADPDSLREALAVGDWATAWETVLGDRGVRFLGSPLHGYQALAREYLAGSWDEALRLARSLVTGPGATAHGPLYVHSRSIAADICRWQGDPVRAAAWLADVPQGTDHGPLPCWALLGLRQETGAPDEAWRQGLRDYRALSARGHVAGMERLLFRVVECALRAEALPAARTALAELEDLDARVGSRHTRAVALLARAHVLGEVDSALEAYGPLSRHGGRELAFVASAWLLAATGAENWLLEACGWSEGMASKAARRRLADLAREKELSLPRRRGDRSVLSRQELRVIEKVVAGWTNRQISVALARSEKSVEAYLARIFAHTGCRTRVELAKRWLDGSLRSYVPV